MNELDDVWENLLEQADFDAKTAGRDDIADYLALKSANDKIRTTAVKWLFDILLEAVERANGKNAKITVEQKDSHKFDHRNAALTGSMLRFRQGVRCLTIEAGWTRTPNDGFMRGNALAYSRFTHFGFAKQNAELVLRRTDELPEWFVVDEDNSLHLFDLNQLVKHFHIFLG
jgi:hypothetical protein